MVKTGSKVVAHACLLHPFSLASETGLTSVEGNLHFKFHENRTKTVVAVV